MTIDAHQFDTDPHTQLRALYRSLLMKQEHFDEFRQMLALYPAVEPESQGAESEAAATLRRQINERISEWIGAPFNGLTATQAALWRAIVVEERFNVALSPWKESNLY